MSSNYFDAFRDLPFQTRYSSVRAAVTADVLEVGLAVAFGVIGISLFAATLIGTSLSDRLPSIGRATYLLYVGAVILVSLFGFGWETGEVEVRTPYKQHTTDEVRVKLGLHVALHGVNITLKGTPTVQRVDGSNESIDYNEHFDWRGPYGAWVIGRFGFGSQASEINQEFLAAQLKGVPLPILWVAEYFTVDGEEIRWGRLHLQAGFYTHLVLWTTFAVWILCFILIHTTIYYGAIYLVMTGALMIIACIIFASVHSYVGPELKIPVQHEVLSLSYGWSFYLVLLTGIVNILLGTALHFFNKYYEGVVVRLFGLTTLSGLEMPKQSVDEDDRSMSDETMTITVTARQRDVEMYAFQRQSNSCRTGMMDQPPDTAQSEDAVYATPHQSRSRRTGMMDQLPDTAQSEDAVYTTPQREPRKISITVHSRRSRAQKKSTLAPACLESVTENPMAREIDVRNMAKMSETSMVSADLRKVSDQSGRSNSHKLSQQSDGATSVVTASTEASGIGSITTNEGAENECAE